MRRVLTRHFVVLFYCCLLNLIITSSYLFYIITSLQMLSTSSASTVACWHLPPTPPLTAVALHLLLPSFTRMAAIVAVAPSSMADCCAFFITCTPSSLSFVLYHAITGSCNVRSHLRKSKYQPLLHRLQSHSHPRHP